MFRRVVIPDGDGLGRAGAARAVKLDLALFLRLQVVVVLTTLASGRAEAAPESVDWFIGRWTDGQPARTCSKGAPLDFETRALFSRTRNGLHGRVEKVSGKSTFVVADYTVTITDKAATLRVTERGKSYRLRGSLAGRQMRFRGAMPAGRTIDIEIGLVGQELVIVHHHGGGGGKTDRNLDLRLSASNAPTDDEAPPDRRIEADR